MPDSNVPCPEPMPFSNESYGYADIDFTTTRPAVFDNKPQGVYIDKILSNQLGDITPPNQEVVGSPILPSVTDSNAKPLLSSYAGADISLPTTLSSTDVNSVSVNDIVSSNQNQASQPVKSEPVSIKAVPMAPMNLPVPVPSKTGEHFSNNNESENLAKFIEKNNPIGKVENFGPVMGPKNDKKVEHFSNNNESENLAKFIEKNNPIGKVENFGPVMGPKNDKKVEHFGNVQTMDNIVIGVVAVAVLYYYVSTYHPQYLSNMDVSKIPIVSQLNDPNVSNENKIIIVVAVVVGLVLVSRMLK